MASYVALLRKEKKSDYSVSFPDFPGCITAGKTLDEAHRFAAEALAFHIEGMEEDGDAIPAPTSLEAIAATPAYRGAFATLVPVSPRSKVQRLNITMPSETLTRIDAYADRVGMNRSAFLTQAALRELSGAFVRQTPGGALERTKVRKGKVTSRRVTKAGARSKAAGSKAHAPTRERARG